MIIRIVFDIEFFIDDFFVTDSFESESFELCCLYDSLISLLLILIFICSLSD